MLTSVNDYLSLGVLILLCVFSIRILFASFHDFNDKTKTQQYSIFDYPENEDE